MHYSCNNWKEVPVSIYPKNMFRKVYYKVSSYIYTSRCETKGIQLNIELFPEEKSNLGDIVKIAIQRFSFANELQYIFPRFGEFSNPTYKDLVFILISFKKYLGDIALQLYPPQGIKNFVVDKCKTYHLYVIQHEKYIPFEMDYCFSEPDIFDEKISLSGITIEYTIKKIFDGKSIVKYIYINNGKHLTWEEKQQAKNLILHPDITAFEVISVDGLQQNTCCLACPSMDYRPDFYPNI